tara:strand:- start:942 stop:1646 length:705 start_codon:yes stop_codon:yes gene_type:complete
MTDADFKLIHNNFPEAPLGDRVEFFTYSQVLSEKENINVRIKKLKDYDYFKDLMKANKIYFDLDKKNNCIGVENCNTSTYHDLISAIKDYPKAKNIKEYNIDLPNKFVVSQWDAKQEYRRVSKDRQKRIVDHYKELGYDIIIIGGEAKGKLNTDLRAIVYAASKADYYVGCDSGMMHIAKMIMPTENIHVYVNLKWSSPGNKFHWENHPDKLSLSAQVRELFNKGAKMNWCENV